MIQPRGMRGGRARAAGVTAGIWLALSAVPTAAPTMAADPPPLTVTATDASRLYSYPNPALSATITGFVNGDDLADLGGSLSCRTDATQFSPPGTYAITCDGLRSAGYTITYVPGNLTVGTPDVIYLAADATRLYGQPDPAFSAIWTSTIPVSINDEIDLDDDFVPPPQPGSGAGGGTSFAFGAAPVCTTPATVASPPGDYPIFCTTTDPSPIGGTTGMMPGTLTITPAPLRVRAQDVTRAYGAPNPPFSATLTGLVAGDGLEDLGGSLACTSTATIHSPVGSYPITCAGLMALNYEVAYSPGTLTIEPADPAPTGDPDTGEALPRYGHRVS